MVEVKKVDVEKTMTWQIVKPESRTDGMKKVIQMAYMEGFMNATNNEEPNQ